MLSFTPHSISCISLTRPSTVTLASQVVHPAVAAALTAAHVEPSTAHKAAAHIAKPISATAKPIAATAKPISATANPHKLKVEGELEAAEKMRAMAQAAGTKAFNLALAIHSQAEKLTSEADKAQKAKKPADAAALRAKAHTLWMQERQALDEVSKDRDMVKTEQAAEEQAEKAAETLAARIDKRILAVDAEVRACCLRLAVVCCVTSAAAERRQARGAQGAAGEKAGLLLP